MKNHIFLHSKNIAEAEYHEGVLTLCFKSGHVYRYFGVPEYVFHELCIAPSAGHYFRENIREEYDSEKIR